MSSININDLETWDNQAISVAGDPEEKLDDESDDDPLSAAVSSGAAASAAASATKSATPFPVRPDLNAKLCLWSVLQ